MEDSPRSLGSSICEPRIHGLRSRIGGIPSWPSSPCHIGDVDMSHVGSECEEYLQQECP
eukprot:NODE_32148_length_382_cov_2.149020.p5 GENE.NODE_32148_length_382_cov_2.149020~~NODE_32148_length_382_cov_2.149020.p5  ORF type:complete len:59 (+),score=8.19 NODE_32148_length_382_cov_2.149020:186-362(+)